MKLSPELQFNTSMEWVKAVLSDLEGFLQDHADCERKASAMAMSFVAKCPDKVEIIPELIETALEEMEHFKMVYQIMEKRGIRLKAEIPKDSYIQQLLALCRNTPDERLMDRMLLASIIECRGAERFRLVAENIIDAELKTFYKMLWISEAKHGNIFVKMILNYQDEKEVYERLDYLVAKEAEICRLLPIRAALH
ncbi:MAG: tRNA-(ms[2]io[6]A)-hydroxylase [Bacteroidetes bacterium]|nr:tRNA-(ms[2]io[6]A)-hydroxylase [Bacteroidota bacterium]HET6243434.1 tRNA-(ms[2]io[6]A)-hydroxylase [Bacteroidia bacterium]